MAGEQTNKQALKKVSIDEKAEKVKRVSAATLSIIWQSGIRSLNPTQVSRSAKVSRPWIYKYVGGSKEDLMSSAVNFFGRLYSNIDRPNGELDSTAWMNQEMEDLKRNFRLAEECPWLLPLYYHFKGSQNTLGRGIDKIEAEYLKKKAQQLKKVAGTSEVSSVLIAELMMTYKLATVHRWQTGELKKTINEEELAQRLIKLLEFVVSIKSPTGSSLK